MNVKELKDFLDTLEDHNEIYFSLWSAQESKQYRLNISKKEDPNHPERAVLSWTDDCLCDVLCMCFAEVESFYRNKI